MVSDEAVGFPLYHGTSLLFLTGILEHGLGGRDPIVGWRVLDLARSINPLVQEHLADIPGFVMHVGSFRSKVEQASAGFNFQHGQTYLSPSEQTAVNYATNKAFGSELLTYTLDLAEELIRRGHRKIEDLICQEYPEIADRRKVRAAPVLIRVNTWTRDSVLTEHGEDANERIAKLEEIWLSDRQFFHFACGQANFRLRNPIAASALEVFLIDVVHPKPKFSRYRLHRLDPSMALRGGPPSTGPEW